MNSRHLVEKYQACRDADEALVLVTVWETLGSTYSKAGGRMLITAGGDSQGLVSGGCLESDLVERARRVLETDSAISLTYDLRDEADELFGLGVGCNGLIRVLLQPVTPARDYQPMASIAAVLLGQSPGAIATVIESSQPELPSGATAVLVNGEARVSGAAAEPEWFAEICRAALGQQGPKLVAPTDGVRVLVAPLNPVPRILILGAGIDAIPLVNVVAELGWRVSIADHRPAYLERAGFVRAEARVRVVPAELAAALDPAGFDAIVVMSHHLATDREYLRQLADVSVPYLGLLGPPARKDRLLGDLGAAGERLRGRLRGPVGIDIGADTAESIAVSIAAEIQQVLVKAT